MIGTRAASPTESDERSTESARCSARPAMSTRDLPPPRPPTCSTVTRALGSGAVRRPPKMLSTYFGGGAHPSKRTLVIAACASVSSRPRKAGAKSTKREPGLRPALEREREALRVVDLDVGARKDAFRLPTSAPDRHPSPAPRRREA